MLAETSPVHLLHGPGGLGSLAELDISDPLGVALPVLVELHRVHLPESAERLFEVIFRHGLPADDEEPRVGRDVVVLLGIVHGDLGRSLARHAASHNILVWKMQNINSWVHKTGDNDGCLKLAANSERFPFILHLTLNAAKLEILDNNHFSKTRVYKVKLCP